MEPILICSLAKIETTYHGLCICSHSVHPRNRKCGCDMIIIILPRSALTLAHMSSLAPCGLSRTRAGVRAAAIAKHPERKQSPLVTEDCFVPTVIPCKGLLGCSFAMDILFTRRDEAGRLRVQGVDPDAAFIHHRCNLMGFRQRLKILSIHELKDQLMGRLLCLETLLNTDQEILGAFPGNPKLHSDDFEWFGLMHVLLPGWNCST